MKTYEFDFAKLEQVFPSEHKVPPLLKKWGEWLKEQPDGSVGEIYFDTSGSDYIAGAQNFTQIIKFLSGENLDIFFWAYAKADGPLPVVVWDTSDGSAITCPSFEAFLARLASGTFGAEETYCDSLIPDIVHFKREEEDWEEDDHEWAGDEREKERAKLAPDLRSELGSWLLAQTEANSLDELIDYGPKPPDFNSWWEKDSAAHQQALDDNPAMQAIAEKMTENFALILWIGDYYRAVIGTKGSLMPPYRDLPEAEAIKPYVQKLREEWAENYPGLGLWHSAIFEGSGHLQDIMDMTERLFDDRNIFQKVLDFLFRRKVEGLFDEVDLNDVPDVSFSPYYEYIYPTEMENTLIPDDVDFAADEARFPRASRRMTDWLKTKLSKK